MYVGYTRILEWDKLPDWGPQVTVWLIYAGLIWLLVRNARNSRGAHADRRVIEIGWRTPALYLLICIVAAIVGEPMHITAPLYIVSSELIVLPGLYLLYQSVRGAFRPARVADRVHGDSACD